MGESSAGHNEADQLAHVVTGLGWVAVGVKGPADLRVWLHKGVGLTTHAAVVPDYAQVFERPGFSSSNLKLTDKAKSKAR